ncbi:hypothetical protein TSOC_013789, partial [Tetrabaena socialis]
GSKRLPNWLQVERSGQLLTRRPVPAAPGLLRPRAPLLAGAGCRRVHDGQRLRDGQPGALVGGGLGVVQHGGHDALGARVLLQRGGPQVQQRRLDRALVLVHGPVRERGVWRDRVLDAAKDSVARGQEVGVRQGLLVVQAGALQAGGRGAGTGAGQRPAFRDRSQCLVFAKEAAHLHHFLHEEADPHHQVGGLAVAVGQRDSGRESGGPSAHGQRCAGTALLYGS